MSDNPVVHFNENRLHSIACWERHWANIYPGCICGGGVTPEKDEDGNTTD